MVTHDQGTTTTSSGTWLDDFRHPPTTYRPVPFWSWNERMESGEVRRQIDQIKAAGWGGAFVHSRIGLTTPYLGAQWFAAVDATLEQCRQRGLRVWLYDEDKWPSGYSGGEVPLADERYRAQCLFALPEHVEPPEEAVRLGAATKDFCIYRMREPLGNAWFNGTSYINTLNRDAVRHFIEAAYASYHRRYGEHYGTLVTAEFTDEPSPLSMHSRLPFGAVPFEDGVPASFERMHGYDPTDHLHLLFVDRPGAARFRLHYFRVVSELFERHFTKQLGQWCESHHLPLTGHFMNEPAIVPQQRVGYVVMPNYRHMQIPGIDHLGRHIGGRVTPKQCQSVVNQCGKSRMLSELYGIAGQNLSFEDRWWISAQQIVLGVNLLNPHLSLYTMAGCRKRDFPANLFYQQPWWPVNRGLDDRLSRLCVAMAQGRYVAEALVVHPQESGAALWPWGVATIGERREMRHWPTPETPPALKALEDQLNAVIDHLLGAQRGFDLGDETLLAQMGEVTYADECPMLAVGQMRYPLVVLPGMATLRETTWTLLQRFEQAGGTVLQCGQAPKWLDGEPAEAMTQWLAHQRAVSVENLPAALDAATEPTVAIEDCEASDRQLMFTHVRDLDDGTRLVMLTNLHRRRGFHATVRCPGPWCAIEWLDLATGEPTTVPSEANDDAIRLGLTFAPAQIHLLRLLREPVRETSSSPTLSAGSIGNEIELPPETWRVERLDDNAMTLDRAFWREGDGAWSAHHVPVLAIQQRLNAMKYDGPVTLRFPVNVCALGERRKVHLVVEHPERCRIAVNGRAVAYAGLPAWRDCRWMPIDITGLLDDGENIIELHYPSFQHGDLAIVEDAFARYGTELEAIYLVGDFAVFGDLLPEEPIDPVWEHFGLPPQRVRVFREGSFHVTDPQPLTFGETTVQGLPFYAGRLRLSTSFGPLRAKIGRGPCRLVLAQLDAATATMSLNGQSLGQFVSQPWEIDVPAAQLAATDEDACLELTLYGTLRNLLGPHHHPHGELPNVTPYAFEPRYDGDTAACVERWARGELQPHNWVDRYCMVGFGDPQRITLRW